MQPNRRRRGERAGTPASFYARLGPAVRARRRKAGIGIRELAARLGVSHQQIQKHESGKHELTLGTIERYARALGIPASQIVADAEDPATPMSPLMEREAGALLSAFERLPADMRDDVLGMIRTLSATATNGTRLPADKQRELVEALRNFHEHRDKPTLQKLMKVAGETVL